MRVGIIDYGVGNLGSISRALENLKVTPMLINNPSDICKVESLILPGVGNFSDCAKLINDGGWVYPLQDAVLGKSIPLMGICLGMQLLANSSTEGFKDGSAGATTGLGFIHGRVKSLFELGCSLPIPHVGWNEVSGFDAESGPFRGIPNGTDYYFVHSYAFVPDNPDHILAITSYDISVTAAVRSGHIWGTQFHPEKSSVAGFQLLRNFIDDPKC